MDWSNTTQERRVGRAHWRGVCSIWTWLLGCLFLFQEGSSLSAAIQFDVFPGYGGVARDGCWFPVNCEIFNDGPGFNAVVELRPAGAMGNTVHRVPLELPTNTRKRIVLAMFGGTFTGGGSWDATLRTDSGDVIAEQRNLGVQNVPWESVLLGSVPRLFAGAPRFPEKTYRSDEVRPAVARLQVADLPDSPVGYDGLSGLYLNSQKALELDGPRARALRSWVAGGGRLIVGLEQAGDLEGLPWMAGMVDLETEGSRLHPGFGALEEWIRLGTNGIAGSQLAGGRVRGPQGADAYEQVRQDSGVANEEILVVQVAGGAMTRLLESEGMPLAVEQPFGRGLVTILLFSPEREPFLSWKNRGWFWARLAGVPGEWFGSGQTRFYGGRGIDGVFGALLDSRQVRKLPVHWLLLLLVVYLVVIGPLDRWWLKKINRQMLTWVTFPAYVVLFSLLIYFIGYRLRAGESEHNRLHVVDVLDAGGNVSWRGWTFASLYSPANQDYEFASEQPYSSIREEFGGALGGGSGGRLDVWHLGSGFRALLPVPVWTSRLYVHEWWQEGALPISVEVEQRGDELHVRASNHLGRAISGWALVVQDRVYQQMGVLPSQGTEEYRLRIREGVNLAQYVQSTGSGYQQAAEARQRQFGTAAGGWLAQPEVVSMVMSFPSQFDHANQAQRNFFYPPVFDLTPAVKREEAVVLAWDRHESAVPGIGEFTVARGSVDTLYRLAVPVKREGRE